MIKVLHVGEYVQGGVATYIKTLISIDTSVGIENHLIMAKEKSEQKWDLPANRIHYYDYKRGIKNIWSAIWFIHRAVNQLQPDIIYCHSTWAGVFGRVPFIFFKKKCRVIYNAHGWSFLRDTSDWKRCIYATVEQWLSRVTNKIINVSKYEYDSAIKYGISSDKMCVIYSGISPKKSVIKNHIQMDVNKVNMLFVGRFDRPKGIDILLEAMDKCSRKDLHLYVIGDNVVSDGMGIEKKNTDKVTFLGWVNHDDVGAYYMASDIVVMPSRWEAFGLVAIEAMKYGKPVIVSDRGALPELIQSNINGYICNIDNKKDILDCINKIEKEELIYLGRNARDVFIKKYSSENMLQKTYREYKQ